MAVRSCRPRNSEHYKCGDTYEECLTKAKASYAGWEMFTLNKFNISGRDGWVAGSTVELDKVKPNEEFWKKVRAENGRNKWVKVMGDCK